MFLLIVLLFGLTAGLVEVIESSKHIHATLQKHEIKNGEIASDISLRFSFIDIHTNFFNVLRMSHYVSICLSDLFVAYILFVSCEVFRKSK